MMNTPICDFVKTYANQNKIRMHMPGHKGADYLGIEALDITEVTGADSLYEASGIIAESETNASTLFGCPTFYSTEGSSHCIRAMLYICLLNAKQKGLRPTVLAGRNAHKAFISAAALLDFDVRWIYPDESESYLACTVTPEKVAEALFSMDKIPAAVYITSPDYLGNVADIQGIAEVCHRFGTLLAVDNAHGAYLKFLEPSQHPMDLGADICCDSAHKTLPVLTGGAYLHISKTLNIISAKVKNALALFGSTSPSYLILQSLDMANKVMDECYKEKLALTIKGVKDLKQSLSQKGYTVIGNEPMKITVSTKKYGYLGDELSKILAEQGIEWEFADSDYLVLMPSADTTPQQFAQIEKIMTGIPEKAPVLTCPPKFALPSQIMTVRAATLSTTEILPLSQCKGRVLAQPTVSCPPAVPILVSGEIIDEAAIKRFEYYGVDNLTVVSAF